MLDYQYRITVSDPITGTDSGRYGLFIRKDHKLVQSLFFDTYQELIIQLDIRNINKSLFKVTKKYGRPFSRYILEMKELQNDY